MRDTKDLDSIVDIIFKTFFPLELELMVSSVHTLSHVGDAYYASTWVLVSTSDMPKRLGRVNAIHEVNESIFFTLSLYETSLLSSGVTGVSTSGELPLDFIDVLVFSLDDLSIQVVKYREANGKYEVSLKL